MKEQGFTSTEIAAGGALHQQKPLLVLEMFLGQM